MKMYRFAILLVAILVLLQAAGVLAATGFGMGPATLEVQRGIKGWDIQETLFIMYTGESDRPVSLSTSGEIADWLSFHEGEEASGPTRTITAANNKWTYTPVTISVPVNRLIGQATGVVHAMTEPDTDAGETVGMYSEVQVVVQVTARKNIPAGTSLVPLSPEPFDLTGNDYKVGHGSVGLTLDVQNVPSNVAVDLTVMKDVPDSLLADLQFLAERVRLEIMDAAYVIAASRVNLEPEFVNDALMQLKVGRAWADMYGVENIRICRIGLNSEVLDTVFVGYDGDSAVFEAVSNGDFSHFALVSVSSDSFTDINWSLIGGIAGGMVPLAIVGILLIRRRREATS